MPPTEAQATQSPPYFGEVCKLVRYRLWRAKKPTISREHLTRLRANLSLKPPPSLSALLFPITKHAPPLPESLADRLCQPQELVGETLSDSPAIKCWKNAFPEVVCDYLAAGAAPLLKPAEIFDPGLGRTRQDPYRQSLVATLPDGVMDLVLWAIKDRMARLAGASYAQGEPLSMLAYRPGDHYKSHYDYLSDDDGIASDDLAQRGQRIATALIRLNQEFTGGDTVFPRLETRWSGVRGDALTFTNTLPDLRGDPRTLHKGEPVETGMKILVSLWLGEHA